MSEIPDKPQQPHSEIDTRGVLIVVLAVGMIIILVSFAGTLMLRKDGPQRAAPTETSQPPPIRLSSDPGDEIEAYRRDKDAQLHSYGWVDHEPGIAHVPIDRAMQILATPQGTP
jgi:hypothetical protein